MPLPATAELALFHQLTPALALHSSINWTNWSKFVQLESELDHHGTMHIKEEHWEDSWRYALGMTYQLAPQWQLRSGIAYDRSPVPAIFLLKTRHGYREGDQTEQGNRVSVTFNLPGAQPLDAFRRGAVIEHEPSGRGDGHRDDA